MLKKYTVLCLHGWGGSPESFTELAQACKGLEINLKTPFLPGFNPGQPVKIALTMEDYTQWLDQEISNIPKDSPLILLGHSHGGRTIAHWLTDSTFDHSRVVHVLWCAPAIIANKQQSKKTLGYLGAKIGNTLLSVPGLNMLKKPARKLLYKTLRVHDYEQASSVMQQTMQNVIKADYTDKLSAITMPIDLFWGTEDSLTPFKDALVVQKQLPNSTLHTIPGVRHAVHRYAADQIAATITTLINA